MATRGRHSASAATPSCSLCWAARRPAAVAPCHARQPKLLARRRCCCSSGRPKKQQQEPAVAAAAWPAAAGPHLLLLILLGLGARHLLHGLSRGLGTLLGGGLLGGALGLAAAAGATGQPAAHQQAARCRAPAWQRKQQGEQQLSALLRSCCRLLAAPTPCHQLQLWVGTSSLSTGGKFCCSSAAFAAPGCSHT